MDRNPKILVSGGKFEGVLEVVLLLEIVVEVVVVGGEVELTPPLDLDDPNMILKELSTCSDGMETIGEALRDDLEDSAV